MEACKQEKKARERQVGETVYLHQTILRSPQYTEDQDECNCLLPKGEGVLKRKREETCGDGLPGSKRRKT